MKLPVLYIATSSNVYVDVYTIGIFFRIKIKSSLVFLCMISILVSTQYQEVFLENIAELFLEN